MYICIALVTIHVFDSLIPCYNPLPPRSTPNCHYTMRAGFPSASPPATPSGAPSSTPASSRWRHMVEDERPEGLKDVLWVFVIATVIKLLLMPAYRSTDFEVHRNWLALTHSLPLREWYFEATSEWTLDYPPLFAYFEWALSQAAWFFDPKMLVVDNLNYASPATIAFQRLSVIASDLMLLVGIMMWSKTWSLTRVTECAHSRGKVAVVGGLAFLNPGLLMVDHVHFQYNGMLLGLLLVSLALLRMEKNLLALATFCTLLLMKHIFFYVVPVVGIYLFGHYCWTVPALAVPRRCRSTRRGSGSGRRSRRSGPDSTSSDSSKNYECDDAGAGSDSDSDYPAGDLSPRKTSPRSRTLSEDINVHVSSQMYDFQPCNFFALVAVSCAALAVTFGPILVSAILHAGRVEAEVAGRQGGEPQAVVGSGFMPPLPALATAVATVQEQMRQIFSRLFPWQRGLCHAYWAPNVWSWYLTADRVAVRAIRVLKLPVIGNLTAATAGTTGGLVQVTSLAVLPNIKPAFTFLVSIVSMFPVLWKVWKFPHPLLIAHAVVFCQMCSFMLGYHVHEKAILMAIIPAGMLAADSVADAKVYLLMSIVGHVSLFPLLHQIREVPFKFFLAILQVLLSYVSLDRCVFFVAFLCVAEKVLSHFVVGGVVIVTVLLSAAD